MLYMHFMPKQIFQHTFKEWSISTVLAVKINGKGKKNYLIFPILIVFSWGLRFPSPHPSFSNDVSFISTYFPSFRMQYGIGFNRSILARFSGIAVTPNSPVSAVPLGVMKILCSPAIKSIAAGWPSGDDTILRQNWLQNTICDHLKLLLSQWLTKTDNDGTKRSPLADRQFPRLH